MGEVRGYFREEFWRVPGDEMFVRPDWKGIGAAIEKEAGNGRRGAAWGEVKGRWVEMMVENLNGLLEVSGTRRWPYRADWSEHFAVVSSYGAEIGGELPVVAEGFRNLARRVLGERIAADPPGGCPIFIFHDRHVAQEYLLAYGVNAFAVAGVCIFEPTHIVMHMVERFHLKLVLIHELNHAVLHALPIPTWLHEGLSRYFETKLLTMANMRFVADMDLGRNKFWRENGLLDFWNGTVFHDSRATMGYVLAQRVVHSLMARDPALFQEFVLKAKKQDGGDGACREVYGEGMLEVVRMFLGKGEWMGPVEGAEG